MEIEEVAAFEVNNKLFKTKDLASKYVKEELEELKIGDRVGIKEWFQTNYDKIGVVCCIENNSFYVVIDGYAPENWVNSGRLKNGGKNIKINDKTYNWEIACKYRKFLIKQ